MVTQLSIRRRLHERPLPDEAPEVTPEELVTPEALSPDEPPPWKLIAGMYATIFVLATVLMVACFVVAKILTGHAY